jgi:hypothetical protein
MYVIDAKVPNSHKLYSTIIDEPQKKYGPKRRANKNMATECRLCGTISKRVLS